MKPQVVGSACLRVQAALDEALASGTANLSPELAAHAAHCPRCSAEVQGVESVLSRLRDAAAHVDLGRLPQVVDFVMAKTLQDGLTAAKAAPMPPARPSRHVQVHWVLGQVAAVAAVLLVAISGLTYVALKVNEAVSGVRPGEVLQQIAAPFNQTNRAEIRNAK